MTIQGTETPQSMAAENCAMQAQSLYVEQRPRHFRKAMEQDFARPRVRQDYAPRDTKVSSWGIIGYGFMAVAAIAPLSYVLAYVIVWCLR